MLVYKLYIYRYISSILISVQNLNVYAFDFKLCYIKYLLGSYYNNQGNTNNWKNHHNNNNNNYYNQSVNQSANRARPYSQSYRKPNLPSSDSCSDSNQSDSNSGNNSNQSTPDMMSADQSMLASAVHSEDQQGEINVIDALLHGGTHEAPLEDHSTALQGLVKKFAQENKSSRQVRPNKKICLVPVTCPSSARVGGI